MGARDSHGGTTDPNLRIAADSERLSALEDHVAAIAHELRSPLGVLQLDASLLESRVGEGELPGMRRVLDRIARNTRVMAQLIVDLEDRCAIECNRLYLSRQFAALEPLIREVIAQTVPPDYQPRILLDVRDRAHANVDVDKLRRVIARLIENALRCSLPNTPVIVRLDSVSDRTTISVIDTGPGLTEDQRVRAFERNGRRADGPRIARGPELYVSRKIVEAHGGTMGIDTVAGKGSRIYVELPVRARRHTPRP